MAESSWTKTLAWDENAGRSQRPRKEWTEERHSGPDTSIHNHMETLFKLDHEYGNEAKEVRVNFHRLIARLILCLAINSSE